MEISVIDEVVWENLEQYDRALTSIKHCIFAYQRACERLIREIAAASSIDEVEREFECLEKIQQILSTISFNHEIEIGEKLDILVQKFGRLYMPESREYWFKRFKSGEIWPNQ